MCGIAGLFLKDETHAAALGGLLGGMLAVLSDRGPDSAGFAIYGKPLQARVKLTLRAAGEGYDFADLAERLAAHLKDEVDLLTRSTHAILTVPEAMRGKAEAWLRVNAPEVSLFAAGRAMEVYKEVGLPASVSARFNLPAMAGSHAVGHTRMATESAVTTAGAHPFSTGPDQCLVHNGSLSNHCGIRRNLAHAGMTMETENDSEVAAAYLTWQMSRGMNLGDALEASLKDLDGFYTFVVGTEKGFGVLRDPIACKPAVLAETEDYVAFGSEYRALAGLPGIEQAKVWEPEPATVYFWERT
ncbi:glutamine amidotransferase [Pelagibius sp. 7325]|uniref:glutamine amidotransferase n=1 Tax=Pelagibius sp. 7325 TaxID=3131994 RepID=UPI0030ED5ABC